MPDELITPSGHTEVIGKWLESIGWRVSKPSDIDRCTRYWWKRFDTEPRCCCNDDKPGVQLVLKEWDNREIGHHVGYELDLTAEPDDGVWVKLAAYGMRDSDIREQLDSQVAKLIRAWQAVQVRGLAPPATEGAEG